MYSSGEGVTQDHKEAAKWYRLAAEQGYALAQNNLGLMYSKGQGVPEDDMEAVKWYLKAAEQGHSRAQTNLGIKYFRGEGVLEDYVTAYMWCNIAAANGNELAMETKIHITKNMTPGQIVMAQELSKETLKKLEANKKKE